jgi:chemotaxis protein MotB
MNSRLATWRRPLVLLFISITLGMTSCTSPDQYRQAIGERDSEISRLQDERAQLKGDRQRLLSEIDSMSGQLRDASMKLRAKPRVVEAPAQSSLSNLGVGYAYRDGVAVITIPSAISFSSGKATLSKTGKQALHEVAKVLQRQHPGAVYSIEGHTDTDPISKSKFVNNRDLSLERATAVLTHLVVECEVLDESCVVVGHGQYRPVDPGTSKTAKAKNRRVEIVVYGK